MRSSVGNTAEDVQTVIKEVTELPIIIGLPCPEIGSSEYGKSRIKRSCCLNSKDNVNIVSDKRQKLNDLTKVGDRVVDAGIFACLYVKYMDVHMCLILKLTNIIFGNLYGNFRNCLHALILKNVSKIIHNLTS